MSATAECTWGEGPDVLVIVPDDNEYELYTSVGRLPSGESYSSFGLKASEARAFAADLIVAAERAEVLAREASDPGVFCTCGSSPGAPFVPVPSQTWRHMTACPHSKA